MAADVCLEVHWLRRWYGRATASGYLPVAPGAGRRGKAEGTLIFANRR